MNKEYTTQKEYVTKHYSRLKITYFDTLKRFGIKRQVKDLPKSELWEDEDYMSFNLEEIEELYKIAQEMDSICERKED